MDTNEEISGVYSVVKRAGVGAGDYVGNLNIFLWVEDDYYRSYSVEFNCFYDSTI